MKSTESESAAQVQGALHRTLQVREAEAHLGSSPGGDRLSGTELFIWLLAEFKDAYFEIFLKGT